MMKFLNDEGLTTLVTKIKDWASNAMKITSVKATADGSHLDQPTVDASVSGDATGQTITFDFKGLQGAAGSPGAAGKDAKISSVTATVEPGHLDEPTATAVVGGEAGNQTVAFTFNGLQGAPGENGKDATFSGTSDQVTMGDGTPKAVTELGKVASASSADNATTANRLAGFTSGKTDNVTWGLQTGKTIYSTGASSDSSGGGCDLDIRKDCPDAGRLSIKVDGEFYAMDGMKRCYHEGDTVPNATTAEKLGSGSVGDDSTPIYLKDGVPTACTSVSGGAEFTGTSSQIVLGDGTTQDISTFITNNIEAIRNALGVVTTKKAGLVPHLPVE